MSISNFENKKVCLFLDKGEKGDTLLVPYTEQLYKYISPSAKYRDRKITLDTFLMVSTKKSDIPETSFVIRITLLN